MKHEHINYTLVGAFTLAAFIGLFIVLYQITGKSVTADHYYTEMNQVEGIAEGTTVTFNGYQVGQVDKIEPVFNDGKTSFNIRLAVKSGWQIRSDSSASIVKSGLLAQAEININEGSAASFLEPGDAIGSTQGNDIMAVIATLGEQLSSLTGDVITPLLNNVNTQVPELTTNLNRLVQKLNSNADFLEKLLNEENIGHMSSLIEQTASISSNLEKVTGVLENLVVNNHEQFQSSVENINRSVLLLNHKIETIGTQLESSSRNINDFSRQLKENPAIILRSKPAADEVVK